MKKLYSRSVIFIYAFISNRFKTDHWENVAWDKEALKKIVNQTESSGAAKELVFLLNDKVAKIPFKSKLLH